MVDLINTLVLAALLLLLTLELGTYILLVPSYARSRAVDVDVDTTGWRVPPHVHQAVAGLRIAVRCAGPGGDLVFRTQLRPSQWQWLMVTGVVSWPETGGAVVRWHPFLLSMPPFLAGFAGLMMLDVWQQGAGAGGLLLFAPLALVALPLRSILWAIGRQQLEQLEQPDLHALLARPPMDESD